MLQRLSSHITLWPTLVLESSASVPEISEATRKTILDCISIRPTANEEQPLRSTLGWKDSPRPKIDTIRCCAKIRISRWSGLERSCHCAMHGERPRRSCPGRCIQGEFRKIMGICLAKAAREWWCPKSLELTLRLDNLN